MPRLGIAKDFLSDYTKLEKNVQRSVLEAIGRFGEHTHAGLHLEKLTASRDPRIRTIRITKFWRGVVLAPEKGEDYTLLAVLQHDDAIAFATSRVFTVNQVVGVLEVRNQEALDHLEPALREVATAAPERLFEHVKDSDLFTLGIDDKVLPLVRVLTTEAHLEALENLLPAPQYDALVALAAGMTVEQAWEEVCRHLATEAPPSEVDPEDLTAAIERTPDRYALVSGPDELAEILAHPFAAWRVFLHGRQRVIAYRTSFSGPTMVSGGAGTGKTVTALHRAAFLSARGSVLLTTYTRNLADALARQLDLLDRTPENVEVVNVDRFAHRVVREATGRQPDVPTTRDLQRLWQDVARETGFSAVFLQREWEQVVLAQNLRDKQAYLDCTRHGRGRGIGTAQREQVWAAIARVVDELRRTNQRTHLQVAADAAEILASRGKPPYNHVVVDEAQDLHPMQWRLLRAAVSPGQDDLFVVGDPHQRIYENRVSLATLGINVRGRSHRLSVNYRTTQEILSWSVRVLSGAVEGLDDAPDSLDGYRSPMHGRRPEVRGFADREAELSALHDQVALWIGSGVEASSIGVAARTSDVVRQAREALRDHPDVHVSTMHGMKGLEFRCVALVGVEQDVVPLRVAVTSETEDTVAHGHDVLRERCLLFVAATRARDAVRVSYSRAGSPFLDATKG
ncbi:UvrD-like helicase family protein [Saccharothrix carnea]|uniref:DNA 3'-5' helicase n=1 Tax=Saccharothrix carnea TaxID=1280637 RepID=A0A2P8IDP6_SACCR|nr:UvrD-helicase domain-containing protein [Saccharothrix carnea]PSL56582.1 UvrD-like helicase family protein [Saccharothrix carnea]